MELQSDIVEASGSRLAMVYAGPAVVDREACAWTDAYLHESLLTKLHMGCFAHVLGRDGRRARSHRHDTWQDSVNITVHFGNHLCWVSG